MAEVTKRISVVGTNEVYRDDRNPEHPVRKGSITLIHRYVVDTDFPSGDSLLIELDGAQAVLYAVAKTPSSTLLTLTEAALSAPRQGISLATGTSTADIEIFVVYAV
jgi:hypothetical protein